MRELPGIVLTTSRYGLAEQMARRVRDKKTIGLSMAAFIAADVLDGVLLRQFDADGPVRRVADGVVDHVSVVRVMAEVYRQAPESRWPLAIIAGRAAVVGAINAAHLMHTGEVTKGGVYQRASNLATAALAVVAARGNESQVKSAGWLAAGVAVATGAMHLKGFGRLHDCEFRRL